MSEQDQTTTPAEPAEDTQGQAEQPAGEEPEGDAKLLKALHAERATIKELKAQLAAISKQQEEQRLASLSETERAIEEARKAGYEAALGEYRGEMLKSKVTAAAAAAGFADPGDAVGFLNVAELEDEASISAAIGELAKAKPYLLKRTHVPLEQGQQGKAAVGGKTPSDWLRAALTGSDA